MKIVFVLAGLGAGGAEKIVNFLAHHRADRGDSVHVIALNAESAQSYFPYDHRIAVEALERQRSTSGFLKTGLRIRALRHRFQVLKPELIISFLTKVNVLVGLAAFGLEVPVVLSERNNYLLQKKNLLWRLVNPIATRRASRLVMQTEDALVALPAPLRPRAVVIPNPVTLPRHQASNCTEDISIVAVGRLERQKGFDLLLQAFHQVVEDLPSARLTIFGEGPERSALERQARRLGIAGSVKLPGVTASPEEWVASGNIFVLSSRFEGFPNVLLEALAAGMATIAFDCPWGPAEILRGGDAGLLVRAGQVSELANATRCLSLDKRLRQRLAAAGPAVAANYSKAVVLARWDDVISRVTSPTRSSLLHTADV